MKEWHITESVSITGDYELRDTRVVIDVPPVGWPNALGFYGEPKLETRLRSASRVGDIELYLEPVKGVEPGDHVYLETRTPVDSRGYPKVAVALVDSVQGNAVILSRPMDFPFGVDETKVTISHPARVLIENCEFVLSNKKRIDFRRLSQAVFRNVTVRSPNKATDGLFIADSTHVRMDDIRCVGGRYTIQITNGTYDARVNGLLARGCWHPIDCSVWAKDVVIANASVVDCNHLVQCHPAIDVWFKNCVDVTDRTPIYLRCLGGGVEDCKLYARQPRRDVAGLWLRPEFQWLSDNYDRVYRRVKTNGTLSASNCRKMVVEDCRAGDVYLDGYSFKVGRLEWRGKNAVDSLWVRRIKINGTCPQVEPITEDGVAVFDRSRNLVDVGNDPWQFSFKTNQNQLRFCLVGIWEPVERRLVLSFHVRNNVHQAAILQTLTGRPRVEIEQQEAIIEEAELRNVSGNYLLDVTVADRFAGQYAEVREEYVTNG